MTPKSTHEDWSFRPEECDRWMAKETTPAQRLKLLEEMLYFLNAAGVDYLAAKHRRHKGDIWRTGEGEL
jgi:hypothetical protein